MSRKLILCSIARQDFNNAKDVFGSMSKHAQNEPTTRFLMYKVAIRCNEPEFAADCLQVVSGLSPEDPTLLYACVLDAQQVGNKAQAVDALQLVLERHDHNTPSLINLPSLLRITIKLTSSLIEDSKKTADSMDAEAQVDRLCKLFEAGK